MTSERQCPDCGALVPRRIDAELAPLEAGAGRELVDRYRGSLHYG